jgi:hypothetical protein
MELIEKSFLAAAAFDFGAFSLILTMRNNLRMMRVFQTFFACFLLGIRLFGQSNQQEPQEPRKCFTDEASEMLRRAYPNGVPGRSLPREDKVAEIDADFEYVIPVVIHVMHANGAEQNVTLAQAQAQIDVLNESFGRYGDGANTDSVGGKANIRFCLATVDPAGNPFSGIDYTYSDFAANVTIATTDTLLKRINQWDPLRYLNIWTVRKINNGAFLGYTYLPEQVAGTVWDGIVLQHTVLGRNQIGTATATGRTTTHEVGHYLGLYHPWGMQEGVCYAFTDYCDDTPPVNNSDPNAAWPTCLNPASQQFACDGTRRQVTNYMDYSQDRCQHLFTNCQVERMRHGTVRYRTELVSKVNLDRTQCGVSDSSWTTPLGRIFLYPNPADGYAIINVDVDEPGSTMVEIFDWSGRKIFTRSDAAVGRGTISLDLTMFAEGSYFLVASNAKATLRTKLFISRFQYRTY